MNYNFNLSAVLTPEYLQLLLNGIQTTLLLSLATLTLALVLGSLLAVLRMLDLKPLNFAIALYVDFHRNVPMMVHILFWYFGVAATFPIWVNRWLNQNNGEFIMAFVAIGLVGAAYISEDLRSAIRAIPVGQFEAARSLGLNYFRTMKRVILPQAFRIAIPPLVNQTVLLFKNTSLAMAIGVVELTAAGREIENYSFRTFEIYSVITVLYVLMSFVLMFGGSYVAKRYAIDVRNKPKSIA